MGSSNPQISGIDGGIDTAAPSSLSPVQKKRSILTDDSNEQNNPQPTKSAKLSASHTMNQISPKENKISVDELLRKNLEQQHHLVIEKVKKEMELVDIQLSVEKLQYENELKRKEILEAEGARVNSSKKSSVAAGGGKSAKSGSTSRKQNEEGSPSGGDGEKGSSGTPADQLLADQLGDSPITNDQTEQPPSLTPGGMDGSPVFADEPTLTELIIEQFEGERQRGLFEGDGFAVFTSNNIYEGQFSEGMMHGHGTFTWTGEKIVYKGEFFKNQITGKGVYQWPDGSVYEGDVFEGIRHGYGVYRHPCGITYEGRWCKGKRHGEGRLEYDDSGKTFYEGEWRENIPHGWGCRQYASGNTYEGTWFNGVRHGQGTMQWLDRDEMYVGNWEDGIQHGMGQYVWYIRRVKSSQYPLRNVYDGEFHRGQRHGFGVFYYPNGARYEGEWRNNIKWGQGKFFFKNGRVYEGEFENDRIREFPNLGIDGRMTPDSVMRQRTRSPLPCEAASVISNESRNTIGPGFQLYADHLIGDLAYQSLIGVEAEFAQITNVIMRNLGEFRKIYNFYSALGFQDSQDNTYVMSNLQFWRFLKDCKIHHHGMSLTDIDRVLVNSWASEPAANDVHNPTRRVLLLDFVNHLVTLSYFLYKEELQGSYQKGSSILSECLLHLISKNLRPYACKVRGYVYIDGKRSSHARTHMEKAFHIYQSLCKPQNGAQGDSVIKMRQFLHLLKDFRLINDDLSATAVVNILSSDDPAVSDGECINLEREMTFLEFFEALVGCAEVFVTASMIRDPNTPREPGMEGSDGEEVDGTRELHHHRDSLAVSSVPMSSTTPAEDATTVTESPVPQTGGGSDTRKSIAAESVVGVEAGKSGGKRHHHRASGRASSKAAPPEPLPEEVPAYDDVSVPEPQTTNEQTTEEAEIAEHEADTDPLGHTEGEQTGSGVLEELDVETRAFNFWTHQVHVFFVGKLFPAAERFHIIRTRLAARLQNEMMEQMKKAVVEANQQTSLLEQAETQENHLELSSIVVS